MTTTARLGAYALSLAVAFGAAWGVGSAVGGEPAAAPAAPAMTHPGPAEVPHPQETGPADGLAATADGYALALVTTTFTPGRPGELGVAVTGPDGAPTPADVALTVVRRDAAGFQQPVAVPGPDGIRRAALTLPAAGVYRLFAAFTPAGGPPLVLGTDLFAAGDFAPIAFAPSRSAQVDGYQVRLDGDLVAGRPSQVFATVSRDGAAVTDLEPVGAGFGELVLLRRSDLAYGLADAGDGTAPAADARSGPGVAFTAQVPTPGGYRAFLTFRHAGAVHVAEFTLTTREGS